MARLGLESFAQTTAAGGYTQALFPSRFAGRLRKGDNPDFGRRKASRMVVIIDHVAVYLVVAILAALAVTELLTMWVGKAAALVTALATLVGAMRKLR